MPEPGLYLVNATGETVPLATEGGNGDRQLLAEALEDHDAAFVREDELRHVLRDVLASAEDDVDGFRAGQEAVVERLSNHFDVDVGSV